MQDVNVSKSSSAAEVKDGFVSGDEMKYNKADSNAISSKVPDVEIHNEDGFPAECEPPLQVEAVADRGSDCSVGIKRPPSLQLGRRGSRFAVTRVKTPCNPSDERMFSLSQSPDAAILAENFDTETNDDTDSKIGIEMGRPIAPTNSGSSVTIQLNTEKVSIQFIRLSLYYFI